MTRSRAVLVGLVLALAAVGCGGDDDAADGRTTTTEAPTTEASSTEPSSTSEPDDPTTSETPTDTIPESELPGERLDIYPYADAPLAVVGVEADDELNARSGPGTSYGVLFTLGPTDDGFAALGHNRTVGESFWVLVEADGRAGWVHGGYVAIPGATNDVTSALPADLGGETMLDVAEAVAAARVGDAPAPRTAVVAGPTVGDLGEVTVDVIGFADDSLKGERLHVFASELDSGEGFVVRTVEATALCARGVTADGLCT